MPLARSAFIGVLVVGLALKLWLSDALPLFGDEAFYWLESRHLALAQDDVPGLTPWLIRLGTELGGNHAWAVRFPFAIVALLTVLLIAHLGGALAGPRGAAWSGLLALLLPLFAINGLLALPDVPLNLAVLVCVEGLRRLTGTARHGAAWLAVGIALGWLSHYRFAVPFAAAGLCLLLLPGGRRLLARPVVWIGGLAGTLVGLAPLLWHQFAQSGTGFAFQFVERHPWQFQAGGLLDPALQAIVATPLLFVLLLLALITGVRDAGRPERQLVAAIGLAILGGYLLLGPFVDVERSRLHWPLPALLIGACVAPAALADAGRRLRVLRGASIALAAGACGALPVVVAALAFAPQRLADGPAYLHGFTGWREAGSEVSNALRTLPADTVVVADHFMLAAELAFIADGQHPVYSLDHAINRKHGRQGELRRMRLDQSALAQHAAGRPLLIVYEESATSLRQRPDWLARLCTTFPGARPLFDRSIDHGRKRLIGYWQAAGSRSGCIPPAVGYLSEPIAVDGVPGRILIEGWALRDRSGLSAVRARIDRQPWVALDHRRPSPGVLQLFPRSDDPRHPNVSFAGHLDARLPAGRYWLQIEAQGHDGVRSIIATTPVDWPLAP